MSRKPKSNFMVVPIKGASNRRRMGGAAILIRKPDKLKLQPGRFYKSKNGDIWCCYRINKHPAHKGAVADCICVETSVCEYFYEDGRYDAAGKRSNTLIEEVDAP